MHLENPTCFYSNSKSSGFSPKSEGLTKLRFHNNAENGLVLLQSGKKSMLGNFKSCHREECHPVAGHRSVGCFGHGTRWKEETLVFIQILLLLSKLSKIQQSVMEVNIFLFPCRQASEVVGEPGLGSRAMDTSVCFIKPIIFAVLPSTPLPEQWLLRKSFQLCCRVWKCKY